jgi:hypothetical protein
MRRLYIGILILVLNIIACNGFSPNNVPPETPEGAAKDKVLALQKLDVNTVEFLTCQEFHDRIDRLMIDNGYEGYDLGLQYGLEADLSVLTYTTVFLNSDNDIAHVHITGDVSYPQNRIFSVDTIWLMEKNDNVWQDCGIVNQ